METLAFIHAAVGYEDPNPAELRSLSELTLPLPSSAWLGLAGFALAAAIVNPSQAMAASTPTPVFSQGSSGTEVQAIQKALGIESDGQYGPKTEAAVTDFQIRQGLQQIDGVVGKETAIALGLNEKYRQVGYVTTRTGIGLNERTGPGLDYRIVSAAPDGEYLYEDYSNVVYRQGYAWTETDEGTWIATNYTREYDGYTPAGYPDNGYGGYERPISYSEDGGVVDTRSNIGLNVRSGPGLGYARIDGADEGDYVSAYGEGVVRDGYLWKPVEGGGWVASDYLY